LLQPPWFVRGPRAAAAIAGAAAHLPFSVWYHACLSRRALEDAIENWPRRLDQSFIHLMCVAQSWALSTSAAFAWFCTLANAYFAFRLCFQCPGALERMVNIGIGVFLFGLAGLARGDVEEFLKAACWFTVGISAMVCRLGGWGHSIMHFCLGGLSYYILVSASKIASPEWSEFGAPGAEAAAGD